MTDRGRLFSLVWLAALVNLIAASVLMMSCGGEQDDGSVRMLFAPSQNPTTMLHLAANLERFVNDDAGIKLRAVIPESYLDVVEGLSRGNADVAWAPPFTYVVANQKAGAVARLQVERVHEQSVIIVSRSGVGQPAGIADLMDGAVAVPRDLEPELRDRLATELSRRASGWKEISVADDVEAVRRLFEQPQTVVAAVSSFVESGPADFIGDGRKRLEAVRPGVLAETKIIAKLEPIALKTTSYYGCFLTRVDSGIRTLSDLAGRSLAYTDEASTSGYIFPRAMLRRRRIEAVEYIVGSHTNVVHEVWAGRVAAGVAYYSPPGAHHRSTGQIVGDARGRALQRLESDSDRTMYLEQMRVIALTDPIPSSAFCVRRGFSDELWRRLVASLERFLESEQGRITFSDLVGAEAMVGSSDAAFDGLRQTLEDAGVSAEEILRTQEARRGRR